MADYQSCLRVDRMGLGWLLRHDKVGTMIKFPKKKKGPRIKNYRSCKCGQGHIHHSRAEAHFCDGLALRVKAKDIKSYDTQVKIPLDVNGRHIANYYIDFRVEHNDGTFEFIEVKGFSQEVWKLKWALYEVLYPDHIKRVVRV